jgi:hypothetical protein
MNGVVVISAAGLLGVCVAGAIYFIAGAEIVRRWIAELPLRDVADAELPPVTILRPIKPGVPHLRAKLEGLIRAMRPGDQVVLGVDADSDEMRAAEEMRALFPGHEIVVVRCREAAALNPKISRLVMMDAHARNDHWVLSDSEAVIDAAWLDALRREWLASGADVVTCGYRFVNAGTWPQRLDAAAALFTLWPGLAFVRRFGRVTFTLGACTALRRADVMAVGGWGSFGDFLAEDNRLGAALANAGRTIRLGAPVAVLDSDALTWREYWRHQRRVAVTYRVCNPAGFAGMLLTLSIPASGLFVGLAWIASGRFWIPVGVVGALQLLRWIFAQRMAKALRFSVEPLFPVMLCAGLVETLCWVLAWCASSVWWAGKRWRVAPGGRLVLTVEAQRSV